MTEKTMKIIAQNVSKPRKNRRNSSNTLCWTCENAVPSRDGSRGCSWSRGLQPVPRWTSLCRFMQINKRIDVYYEVLECPEYIRDKDNKVTSE